jgi:hypothetical protein
MFYDTENGVFANLTEIATADQFPQKDVAVAKPEKKMKQVEIDLDTTKRQEDYVAKRKASGGLRSIVAPDAFIRGMRDLGYKDPSWAMAELIDNSVQSGCNTVEIRFNFDGDNESQRKNPSQIALIDDGTGMRPEMLPYAVEWGGTDREDNRNGFGRYGYGLPSSCVSIACRYRVYSKTEGANWHSITVDIDQIVKAGNDPTKLAALMVSTPCDLPNWLSKTPENGVDLSKATSGTVIVLEDLDRLRKLPGWTLVKSLSDRLLKKFGLIYRHWLTDVDIVVDGRQVEAIDPLFLMSHARFVNETPVTAKKVAERAFEVTTAEGKTGGVRIRAALLPPLFTWGNYGDLSGKRTYTQRWSQVIRPTEGLNGIMVCREGRQIDVVQPEWTKFQNYDVYLKIEIDFDPVLDEFFNMTTSKQQIRIDETMWAKLADSGQNSGGLKALVLDMRKEFVQLNAEMQAAISKSAKKSARELPAANAMVVAEKLRVKTPRVSNKAKEEARKNLETEVLTTAQATGETVEKVREKIQEVIKKRPWDIELQALDEGPFFRPKRMGEQKRIVINTAHPFFTRLYEPATPATKSALEVLLFVLADGEINADDNHAEFYKAERAHHWSPMLQTALAALVPEQQLEDDKSTAIENTEMESGGK